MNKLRFNIPVRSNTWFWIAVFLYTVSTIGLAGGISTGMTLADQFVSPETLVVSLGWIRFLSGVGAIAIQFIETVIILTWNDGENDTLDHVVAGVLLFVDFLAINLVLGNHVLLVWFIQGGGTLTENIFAGVAFTIKVAIAFLGAVYAEIALGKALDINFFNTSRPPAGYPRPTSSAAQPFGSAPLTGEASSILHPPVPDRSRYAPKHRPDF